MLVGHLVIMIKIEKTSITLSPILNSVVIMAISMFIQAILVLLVLEIHGPENEKVMNFLIMLFLFVEIVLICFIEEKVVVTGIEIL